jgi:hypothetical protein
MTDKSYPTDEKFICKGCQFEGYLEIIQSVGENKFIEGYGNVSKVWELGRCLVCSTSHLLTSVYDDGFISPRRIVIPDFSTSSANLKNLFGQPSDDAQFKCDVFMVMPFAEDLQPIYDDHIKPVTNAKNLRIKRGDDFFADQSIMADIWSAIYACKLVIADCTGKNPNVFYELGIAHTLGQSVILLTQQMDDIPFDLRHLRVIQYEYTPPGMKIFEEKLADAIDKLLD